MAKIRPLLGTLSGKVGGEVYAHNRGGQYVRAFTPPTDPNTPQQNNLRLIMLQLSANWATLALDDRRIGWETYARNVPLTKPGNRLVYVSGRNHYLRCNVPRLLHSLPRVDDAPEIFTLGETNLGKIRVQKFTANSAAIFFDTADPWPAETNSALLLQVSRPQPITVNFFKAPLRTWASVKGNVGAPPTSPQVRALPFGYTLGVRGFWRARVTRADGRLSRATMGLWDHS